MPSTPWRKRLRNSAGFVIQTSACGRSANGRVRNHGRGIFPEHLDRIFEPFHTTRPNGPGMGLAICRRIAESHGGGIHAANHPTGGAEFSFSRPFQAGSREAR